MCLPWYLRWYFILPVFLLVPAGSFVSLGLMRIRSKAVPSSRRTWGWLIFALGLMAAVGVYFSGVVLVGWLFGPSGDFRTVYFVAGLFVLISLYGLVVAVRAQQLSRLVDAVDAQGMRSAEAVARVLRRNDVVSVSQEISRAISKGWLYGYRFDPISGVIYRSAEPFRFLSLLRRSWLGAVFVLFGLFLAPFMVYEIVSGGSPRRDVSTGEGRGTDIDREREYRRREEQRRYDEHERVLDERDRRRQSGME